MTGDGWPIEPLSYLLVGIEAGKSPDLPDSPAGPGEWGVLKVSAVHTSGFRAEENKRVETPGIVDTRYQVHPGDLLISRANTPELVGSACIVPEISTGLLLSDKTLRLRVDPTRALAEYVNTCLSSPALRRQIVNAASGSSRSMQNIGQKAIERLRLPVPPIEEQRRVVDVLNSVTELERVIEASIAKFHNLRQGSLLASMKPVASAQPAAGWDRVPLKDVVPSAEYGISEALGRDACGVPVLRMNNIQGARIDADDLRYCPVPVPSRLFLRRGDVLFNRTNSLEHIGKAAIWRNELPNVTFASYLVRLIPDLQRVTPEYLVEWLMHPLVRQRVRSISTVAVQQVNVNPSRLRELEIDLPVDLAEQRRIVAMLEACDEQIGREEEELNKLRALKQGLVDDLLSGRVKASGVAA
ncbi:restriction endonuclease subunit S [Streptomyces albogriseolus]|uniref:restriction endonuclease subunit S n=1 Tax=Streptomyces albogriseolus TaxID=1887 RepID=UPI0036CAC603